MESNISINLFNGFGITKDGEPILESLSNTRKTKMFVAYLLVNRERTVSHKELFDLLWSGEEYANPGTALRTLLYRFRGTLSKEGAQQLDNAIISRKGVYQWNSDLDVKIDVIEFEEKSREGLNLVNMPQVRREYLKEAIELYKGPMLPDFSTEPWMISKAAYYRDLYSIVVVNYIQFLKQDEAYAQIVAVSERALEVIGSSEVIELEGQMARLNLAAGGQLDNKTLSYYNMVYSLSMALISDANRIQADLEDDTVEQKAFICDYATFKEIYRLQRRMQARTKATMFLGVVDVRLNEETIDGSEFDLVMESIIECCASQLRCGDAICKMGSRQLAILFPSDSYEDAARVLERLKQASRERTGKNTVIVYKLCTLKNARE